MQMKTVQQPKDISVVDLFNKTERESTVVKAESSEISEKRKEEKAELKYQIEGNDIQIDETTLLQTEEMDETPE